MSHPPTDADRKLAEAVRQACLETVRDAYQEAGFSGLCAEGRWTYAMDALKTLDLRPVIERETADASDQADTT